MKKIIIFLILMLPFIFSSSGWGAYGAAIYKAKCAACHGADGQGTAMAPAFKGNAFIGKRSFEEISAVILQGRDGAAKKYKQFAIGMPKRSLADEDLKAVIDHLRSLSGIAYSAPKPEFTEKTKSSNNSKTTDMKTTWVEANNFIIDKKTNKVWSKNADLTRGKKTTWAEANNFINELNRSSYLGFSDWSLPDNKDLESLKEYADMKGVYKNLDNLFNKTGFVNVQNGCYWSSTPYAGNDYDIFNICLDSANLGYGNKHDRNEFVWPVRKTDKPVSGYWIEKDLILVPLTYFERIKQGQSDSFSSDQSNSSVDFKGATIYKTKCAACHGKEGQGTAMAPAFKGSSFLRNSSDYAISDVILQGRNGTAKKYRQFAIGMPRQSFSEDELGEVIIHLKALAGIRVETRKSPLQQNDQPKELDITSLFGAGNDNVIKTIEQELSSKINELYSPRGEFETTREFEERQKSSKKIEERLRSEYESRINDERNKIDKERKETLYPCTFDVIIEKYDADREGFNASFLDNEVFITIPREKAIVLNKHKEKTLVRGMLRYYNSEYAELVSAFLIDTETLDNYAFGKQSGIASVATTQKAAPVLNISSITLFEPSGNGILDAGESGRIKLTLKNSGKGAGFGVSMEFDKSALPDHLKLNEKIYVGTVNPDEEKTVESDITALEEIGSADIRLKTTLTESSGFDSNPMVLSFKTKQLVPPLLQIARIQMSDSDGNRVITKGKEATLTLTIQNAGAGIAKDVIALIESSDSNVKLFGENKFAIGELPPGESKKATFNVAVTQRYNGPKILPLSFKIREGREKFSIKPEIQIALNEDAPDIKVVKVEAKEAPEFKLQSVEDINAVPSIEQADKVIGTNDLAVVIGIERYRNLPKSEYSYNDAKLVKGYLRALGFADRNIEYLTDDGATLSGIRKSIESWLPNRMKKNNRVFLYYSGHGSPDPATGEAFLMPHDGDPNYLHETGYPLKRIYAALSKLEASEIIVVVDACFSGAGGRSVLAKGARPAMVSIENPVLASQKIAVLSSTQGAQISTSFPEKEHGLFTYYFLKALKEGKKDMADIYSYLKPLVEDEAKALNVRQTPAMNPDPATLGGKFMLRK